MSILAPPPICSRDIHFRNRTLYVGPHDLLSFFPPATNTQSLEAPGSRLLRPNMASRVVCSSASSPVAGMNPWDRSEPGGPLVRISKKP